MKTTRMSQLYMPSKSIIYVIIFSSFLFFLNLVIGSFYWDYVDSISFVSDETNHVSAAKSFADGKDFHIKYFEFSSQTNPDFDNLLLEQPFTRPITYHILLGIFYSIFETTENTLFYGSIFSTILGSLFLVIFFNLIRKYFDFFIAALSSVAVLFTSEFLALEIRPIPIILFFIFGVSALYFLKKKISHYVLFGFFIGLSHTCAATGIVLGTAYLLFLVFKREFKGALIVFLSWNAILIPIYLRNYFYTKDIGAGLYLPFSDIISNYLFFLPSSIDSQNIHNNNIVSDQEFQIISSYLNPTSFIQRIIEQIDFFNSLPLFIFLIIGLTIFAVFVRTFNFNFPRYYVIVILFLILNLTAIYYTTQINSEGFWSGTKHLLLSTFLLIPIAIMGVRVLFTKIKFFEKKKIISGLFVFLLFSPVYVESIYGLYEFEYKNIPGIRTYAEDELPAVKSFWAWANENIPPDSIVMSQHMRDVVLRGDFSGISINDSINCQNSDALMEKFEPKFIISYPPQFLLNEFKNNVEDVLTLNYVYIQIYSQNHFTVYELQKSPLYPTDNEKIYLYLSNLYSNQQYDDVLQFFETYKTQFEYNDCFHSSTYFDDILLIILKSAQILFDKNIETTNFETAEFYQKKIYSVYETVPFDKNSETSLLLDTFFESLFENDLILYDFRITDSPENFGKYFDIQIKKLKDIEDYDIQLDILKSVIDDSFSLQNISDDLYDQFIPKLIFVSLGEGFKFEPYLHQKLGEHYEYVGDFEKALQSYETSLRFGSHSQDEIELKIVEIESFLHAEKYGP